MRSNAVAPSRGEGTTCKQPQPIRGSTDGQCTVLNACHSVEHVTIRSTKSFEDVRAKLATLAPRIDDGIFTLGERTRALRELEACPPLTIFGQRDHGALPAIAGLTRRSIQFDIGNPLTASKMTRHQL